MPRKKLNEATNQFDYLEKKYGVTPAQILKAVEEVGPYRARLETYFSIQTIEKNRRTKKGSLGIKFYKFPGTDGAGHS